jgi:hypothetical protein
MDDVLAENIGKLKKRHPKGFTEKNRAPQRHAGGLE